MRLTTQSCPCTTYRKEYFVTLTAASTIDDEEEGMQAAPSARVVALVPAFNEEALIARTIASLMKQTVPFEYVLVIVNNCSDNTEAIVRDLQTTYGEELLRMMVMDVNPHKKAGALNYGFKHLDPTLDYVFSMDSDTIVHPSIVAEGIRTFEREPRTGGVCSAYRTLPRPDTLSLWETFLWRIQNIEFGLANAWRVENYKSARVLPGVSVMYRMTALQEVHDMYGNGNVWAINDLVEDYTLTLDLKDLGWEAKSSFGMISWSDVPLKLRGKGGLWDQRKRWYSGTVDKIRERGLTKKHSRYEAFTIVWLMIGLLMRTLLYASYTVLAIEGIPIQWLSPFLVIIAASIATQLYRLKYADQLDWWQRIITATMVVNELYAIYRELIYAYSIWLSFRRPHRAW
jgi:biofilm PGA synthesis N-glycosyltransferase PgaC